MQIISTDPLFPVEQATDAISHASQSLHEKVVNLDALVENLDGFVWSVDRDMRYIILNTALRKIIKEVIGVDARPGDKMLDVLGVLDPSKAAEWAPIYQQALNGKGQQFLQKFIFHNEPRHFEISINPIRKGEVITGISCFARDVTAAIHNSQQLQESEMRFRSLIENSTDIIVVVNNMGEIVYGSPSIENHFGLLTSDYSGVSAFDFVHPEELEALTLQFLEVLEKPGIPVPIKCRAQTKHGLQIWVEGTVTNLLYVDGINGIVCNCRDVTERVRAAKVLEEREQRFRLLIENNADFIMMASAEGNFIYGSPSVRKYLGYSDEEYLDKTVLTFIHPDSVDNTQLLLANLAKFPEQAFPIDLKLVHKEGHEVWVEGLATNLLVVPGINALVGNFRDISERKKAEKQIQASEDLYRNLFNKSPLPTWVCCTEGLLFLEANEAAVKHYGYSREEFLERTAFDITPPENHHELKSLIANGNINRHQQLMRRHVKKNQEVIFVEILAHTITYKGLPCYLIVANDITEKIRLRHQLMEEKISRQKETMQAAIEAQEGERAYIGRELHDNVKQILGMAKLCLEHGQGNAAVQPEMTERAMTMISNAIDEIRKLSKSLIQTYEREIGLQLSLENLVESVRLGNGFQVKIDFSVPDESLLEDKLKMTVFRIVQEQLNNILKHADANQVVISVKQPGDLLSLYIADNGKGFDVKQKRDGIGITNIISRAEIFNGLVEVDSEPGKGCRMLVNFKVR
jgi:PAS domain S-box-containing protein